MGLQTIVLETRPTDTMVGGSGGTVPDLRHQPSDLASNCCKKKKVGVGIKYRYTDYILNILQSYRYIHCIFEYSQVILGIYIDYPQIECLYQRYTMTMHLVSTYPTCISHSVISAHYS